MAPGLGLVKNENTTKGFEYEKGKYVLLDEREIDESRPSSSRRHRHLQAEIGLDHGTELRPAHRV